VPATKQLKRQERAAARPEVRRRGLELVRAGLDRPPEATLRQLIELDQRPEVYSLNDALGLTCIDEQYFALIPGLRGQLLRRLPLVVAQALEVFRNRSDIDVVVSWSEAVAVPMALLMLFLPRRPAHVGIFSWLSKPKKAVPLWLLKGGIDRFVVHPPLQHRFAMERLGLSPERAPGGLRWWVDTKFWRPTEDPGDMICCVGREMRDYPTLIQAIGPLAIPCHIAAGAVTTKASNPWLRTGESDLPIGLSLGAKAPDQLRQLYERSRFVVIPLLASDTDNGITTALEAFAMGKPVICTDTPGQVGVLEDGVNCLRVPPEDPLALRQAIERLWSDPDLCVQMGAAGRELVERRHNIQQWVDGVGAVVASAIAERSPGRVTASGA
jgi:glycosyltransferase involved in cell wall biosynthesis